MRTARRGWKMNALGLLLLTGLSGCVATVDGGYVEGVYVPTVYEYGGWGPRYHVAPPRGGERHEERRSEPARPQPSHAYRPAPPSRQAPSIPARPRGR